MARLALHHLSLVSALGRTGGVAAAAAHLGITQSAASHRLAEAERRLATPLVLRASGRVSLTPEGLRIAEFADRMLEDLTRLEHEVEVSAAGGQHLVRLGQATYSRFHWLPAFIAHLSEAAPSLRLDISGEAMARPLTSLLDGATDVSTVYGRPTASARFRWARLGHDPLVAVMAPSHPLADCAFLTPGDVGSTHLYSYPFTAEPGLAWTRMLGLGEAPFRRLTVLPTPEASIDLIRAGYGIGFFSQWVIGPEIADGTLITRPLWAGGESLDWWVVTRKGDAPDSPALQLSAALERWSASVRQTRFDTLGFQGDQTEG